MTQFQKVKLKTNKYCNQGLSKGAIGVVLECYDENNFEVEFSDENGFTIEIYTFPKDELEIVYE